MMRALAWLLLLALLLPMLTACDAVKDVVPNVFPSGPGTLRLTGQRPLTLDPALAQDSVSWSYLIQIYSGLVRLNDKLEVVPDIARSWTTSDGGRMYTFELRDDVKFHDGRAVTAEDFKFSLERALDPATHSPTAATYLGDLVGARDRLAGKATTVAGITVVGPHTLRLTLDAPKTYFLAKLTYPTAFVLDERNVQAGGDWWKQPNGTGPFRLKAWDEGDQIVLVRNSSYYGGAPRLGEVDYYVGPERPIGLYQSGKLDVVGVGLGDLPRVTDPQGKLKSQLRITPQLSLWYLGFNVQQKPFDDPNVRLAFAYATNRRLLINGLYRGYRTEARGILPPGLPGFDSSFAGLPFDAQKAQDSLARSSYRSAAKLPPIVLSTGPGTGAVAQGFARMYRQTLGVDVAVEVLQNTFYDDLREHRPQMYFVGWAADYPDPQDFLEILFEGGSDGNYSQYDNPEVNRILAAAAIETNAQTRLDLYRQVERLVVQDAPVIPLFYDTQYDLVRPAVQGLTITPMGILSLTGVSVRS